MEEDKKNRGEYEKKANLLMSMLLGIGEFSSLMILAEIGDIREI